MPLSEEPLGDHELPSEDDLPIDADELGAMICPNCRAEVTEDTPKCPQCGDWITPVDASGTGPRRWLFVGVVVLMLLALLRWIF